MAVAAMQDAYQHIRSSLGFSTLPKDTCMQHAGQGNLTSDLPITHSTPEPQPPLNGDLRFSPGSMWIYSVVPGTMQILLSILTHGMTVTPVMWLPTPSSMVPGALKRGTAALQFLLAPPSPCLSQSPEIPIRCVGRVLWELWHCDKVKHFFFTTWTYVGGRPMIMTFVT